MCTMNASICFVCCVVRLVVSLADVAGHHGAGLPEGLPQPPSAGPPRQPGPGEGAAAGSLDAPQLRHRGEERPDLNVAPDRLGLPPFFNQDFFPSPPPHSSSLVSSSMASVGHEQ